LRSAGLSPRGTPGAVRIGAAQADSPRFLAAVDVGAVRSLYNVSAREEECMRLGAAATAMALLLGAEVSQAQSKSANELARLCIADNKSPCSQYIWGLIDTWEKDRRARGGPSCLGDDPSSEHVVKIFVRAIVANYPYADLPAAVAVENIYNDKCKNPN
jgi:hypothetical protein